MSKKRHAPPYFLDRFSRRDVLLWEQHYQAIADYYWEHYCYFANQRSLIFNELKQALAINCNPFTFSQWQRVVNYKFSLEPLSAKGSVLNDPGGRFNIGDIDQIKFPRFAALYLAEDRETAYKEKFGLGQEEKHTGLTAEELLLTSRDSITIVTLRGEISQVLDLNDTALLKDFFELINTIKLPNNFVRRASRLNIDPMHHIKTLKGLYRNLLQPNWRDISMLFDIPANSQILGHIAHAAGIEGILYPSKKSKKNCLAVFPENFSRSTAYIEIEGDVPNGVKCKRLDAQSYLQNM